MSLDTISEGFSEYDDEFFTRIAEKEAKLLPDPDYMAKQRGLNWSIRSRVVKWMFRVRSHFDFAQETLYLSVNILDRYLSSWAIEPDKIGLLATAAMLVAAKYEQKQIQFRRKHILEIIGLYPAGEVLKAEQQMLKNMDYEVGWPGPTVFLYRINEVDGKEKQLRVLAHYFLQVMLLDERFVGKLPSITAAASYCLARGISGRQKWTSQHIQSSGYTESQLHPLINVLLERCRDSGEYHQDILPNYRQIYGALFAEVEKKLRQL